MVGGMVGMFIEELFELLARFARPGITASPPPRPPARSIIEALIAGSLAVWT